MLYKVVIVILVSTPIVYSALFNKLPEDATLDFTGLALKYAGVVEEHAVSTPDGYILKLFRIPGNRSKPVLLMHGLLCSSDDFIIRGNDSLAIILLKAGYEVWFGNYRGNKHSRHHIFLDPDRDKVFWKFGPQEHGVYDLGTSIDFILSKTGQTKLSLIGHSEGTMITYILGSERPEYNDKIKVFIALAPVCHIYKEIQKIPGLIQTHLFVNILTTILNTDEVGGYDSFAGKLSRLFCARTFAKRDCRRSQFNMSGWNIKGLEDEFLPILYSHSPGGTSKMNLEHMLQMILSKRFAKFDFGPKENLKKYGSKTTPEYSLSKVTMTTVLMAAKNDFLAVLDDTKLQAKELPNVEDYIIIEDELFNHNDFIWGNQAPQLIHPKILKILERHN